MIIRQALFEGRIHEGKEAAFKVWPCRIRP
ncbi:hypothetical protein ABID21_003828 [Pseudorhizobium tarimense]|uniref:Uncharacterized protein n=1 Tax=Pseudorhizobium tarimense TaxID=1079109 RepID=A0ABV2HAW8_9HYPH